MSYRAGLVWKIDELVELAVPINFSISGTTAAKLLPVDSLYASFSMRTKSRRTGRKVRSLI